MATSIELNEDLEARILKLSAERRRPADWIMREAIQEYLEREEARVDFGQEAEASWEEFCKSGLHLTGEEMRAWLRGWGTEAETDLRPCHD
jgi:predicted transcriptional regulator